MKKYLSTSELFADYINKESEEIGFDFADVLTMMDNIMYRQVKKLENIYKSVAGDKHIS